MIEGAFVDQRARAPFFETNCTPFPSFPLRPLGGSVAVAIERERASYRTSLRN